MVRRKVNIRNMQNPVFRASAMAAKLNLTPRFTTMPSKTQLIEADAVCLHTYIEEALQLVPDEHRRTWQKMLLRAFPEIPDGPLVLIFLTLVVRCWQLRRTAKPNALHHFVEFCSGQGNLTLACLQEMLHCVATDVEYHPDQNMVTRIGLRIWVDVISETVPGAGCWWGTRCSSFVGVCRRHHKRSEANNFWGDTNLNFVNKGNMMQVPSSPSIVLLKISAHAHIF